MAPGLSMVIQVRAFGETALDTLLKSGASSTARPPAPRDVDSETTKAQKVLRELFPVTLSPSDDPSSAEDPLLDCSQAFQASLVADLVHARNFGEKEIWNRCVAVYSSLWLGKEEGTRFAETVRLHFQGLDQVGNYQSRGITALIW